MTNLTNTMLQNIEQQGAEFFQPGMKVDEVVNQINFLFTAECFDFEKTKEDEEVYLEAFMRGVKRSSDAHEQENAARFQALGEQYAIDSDFSNSEDAWEHAISNDSEMIAALRGLNEDARISAAEDFGQGFADVLQAEKAENEIELNSIMTAAEAAETFGLAEATVRQSINRWQIPARKSAGTWLIRRADAEKKWKV